MKKFIAAGFAGLFALGLAAAALAGGGYGDDPTTSTTTTTTAAASTSTTSTRKTSTHSFKAALNVAQERPKSKAPAGAGGSFSARSVEANDSTTFTWKLTFHGLSGKAGAAHVHLGKKGVPGAIIISLCGPCKTGQTGKVKIAGTAENAMKTGKAYVNVHTAKNAAGEIRGQVVLTK